MMLPPKNLIGLVLEKARPFASLAAAAAAARLLLLPLHVHALSALPNQLV